MKNKVYRFNYSLSVFSKNHRQQDWAISVVISNVFTNTEKRLWTGDLELDSEAFEINGKFLVVDVASFGQAI